MAASAARMSRSRASWVIITTGTASPCARPFWSTETSEMSWLAQDPGDLGEDAGPVHRHDTQVVRGADLVHRSAAAAGARSTEGRSTSSAGRPWATRRAMSSVSDQTAEAVGSWPAPAAVEHQVADVVAGDEDGVEDAGDGGHRRAGGDHRRVHAGLERAVDGLRDGEELDAVAELARVHHVLLGDPGDALRVDVLRGRPWCGRPAWPGSAACGPSRAPRCRASDRPPRSRWPAPPSGPRRSRAPRPSSSRGCSCRCR